MIAHQPPCISELSFSFVTQTFPIEFTFFSLKVNSQPFASPVSQFQPTCHAFPSRPSRFSCKMYQVIVRQAMHPSPY